MTGDPAVDASIIGELILGELPEWYVGVCRLEHNDHGYIRVVGENDLTVGSVSTDHWRESTVNSGEVHDLGEIAERVNNLIQREHDAL